MIVLVHSASKVVMDNTMTVKLVNLKISRTQKNIFLFHDHLKKNGTTKFTLTCPVLLRFGIFLTSPRGGSREVLGRQMSLTQTDVVKADQ